MIQNELGQTCDELGQMNKYGPNGGGQHQDDRTLVKPEHGSLERK